MIYDMRPDEVALRKKLKHEEILGCLGAVLAGLFFAALAYLACLVSLAF